MLGEAISTLRKKRKISQLDLCEIIDKTQPYLSMIENNQADPSLKTLKKIADVLKVPVGILFWFTVTEEQVPEKKRESFLIMKPAFDDFIMSIFDE